MRLFCAIFLVFWTSCSTNGQYFQYFYTNPAVPAFYSPLPTPVFSDFFNQLQPQQSVGDRQQKGLKIDQPEAQKEDSESVSVEAEVSQPQLSFSPASDNYRGFGYHTKYEDGASATVVFFRGGPTGNSILETPSERLTVASNNLDAQNPLEQRVRTIIEEQSSEAESRTSKQSPFPNLETIVKAFQEQDTPGGVVHFYSTPNRYPASTAPLATARALNDSTTANGTSTNNTKTESDVAESIQTRTVLKVNSLIDSAERESSTTEGATTTTAGTAEATPAAATPAAATPAVATPEAATTSENAVNSAFSSSATTAAPSTTTASATTSTTTAALTSTTAAATTTTGTAATSSTDETGDDIIAVYFGNSTDTPEVSVKDNVEVESRVDSTEKNVEETTLL